MKWTALLIGFVIAWNSPATEDCVQQAARTTRLVATSPANSLHIASEVDAAFYESCVKNQIDVEVFVPTAALD